MTVELEAELWEVVEAAAAAAGVEIEDYVRDAVAHRASAFRLDAEALIAESGSQELYARHPESNIEFVGRLWHAFRAGGVDGIGELVDGQVAWQPLGAQAPERSHAALEAFWALRDTETPVVTRFQPRGDHVLVHTELPSAGAPLWLLFGFDGPRLAWAAAFDDEAAALRALGP